MAITTDDFNKVWASTSPLTPYSFSESQYKEGWNFIGGTPPARQMWDFLQKQNDEKSKFLLDKFGEYLPLSGGTLTGDLDVKSAITCKSVTSSRVNVRSGRVAPVNTLQRSAEYSVGDIVYTSTLNAKYYLLCVTAGKTSATMPSFSGAESNTEVTDGTVVWRVQTITSQESVETRISAAETRISTAVPTGVVQAFAGRTTPQGWLLCDGSAVSRTNYADLYAVIGTTYGAGDGTSTFNLPNLVDKFIQGNATSGTVKAAGLPNITGTLCSQVFSWKNDIPGGLKDNLDYWQGALNTHVWNTKTIAISYSVGDGYAGQAKIDASKSNAIYGNSDTVQPPALTMRYIIKY